MPFSKTRNDIVHMDAYHRDPKRESFKPLLRQIAEDFMAEGFEDVGPQITKLTIKDDDLTNYIDEFICYYYDSTLNRVGTGASGIGWGLEGTAVFPTPEELVSYFAAGPQAPEEDFAGGFVNSNGEPVPDREVLPSGAVDADGNGTGAIKLLPAQGPVLAGKPGTGNSLTIDGNIGEEFTRFRLDGPNSTRNKNIDDYYRRTDWNESLALHAPSYYDDDNSTSGSGTSIVTNQRSGQTAQDGHNPDGLSKIKRNTLLGPNCELFHYINPHPSMRGTRVSDRALASGLDKDALDTAASIGDFWDDHPSGKGKTVVTTTTDSEGVVTVTTTSDPAAPRPLDLKDNAFYKRNPPAAPDPLSMYQQYFLHSFTAAEATGTPQLPQSITAENSVKFVPASGASLQRGVLNLNTICRAVYLNEFNKIKSCITNNSRNVKFSPDAATGINTQADLTQYKEEILLNGETVHYFWMSNYKDEFFFPAGVVEPKHYVGELLLGFDPSFEQNNYQRDDVYKFAFIDTAIDNPQVSGLNAGEFAETIDVKVGIDNSLEGYTLSVLDAFKLSDMFDAKGGRYDVQLDPERIGVLLIRSNNIGHNLTCSLDNGNVLERVERVTTSHNNTFTIFPVVQQTMSTFVTAVGGTPASTTTAVDVYRDGYNHEIQIRGIDGANTEDSFSITLSGLLDEDAGNILLSTAVKDITVNFTTQRALNSAELSDALADVLKQNPYVREFMVVSSGSNFITVKYKENSRAFMKKGVVGISSGLMNFVPTNSGVVGGSATITGVSLGTQVAQDTSAATNGFIKSDLPIQAQFSATCSYVASTNFDNTDFGGVSGYTEPAVAATGIGNGDPMDFLLDTKQNGATSDVEKVRLSFPLARDFGTFSKPPQSKSVIRFGMDLAIEDDHSFPNLATTTSGTGSGTGTGTTTTAVELHTLNLGTNYPLSYYQHVLQPSEDEENYIGSGRPRPKGPQESFDWFVKPDHPNEEFGHVYNSKEKNSNFSRYTHEIAVESFEYISDYSMGPIIFDTKKTHPLSGPDGEQPWRIRFDVSRGTEVLEASPYINEVSLQVKNDMDASSGFEYLRVHIATEHQLKENGKVALPQGRDGVKQGVLREPGHLGALRTQFKGYRESAAHLVSPYVDRRTLETTQKTGFLYGAGVVGHNHSNINWEAIDGLGPVFDSTIKLKGEEEASGVMIPPKETIGADLVELKNGNLKDGEFRFEERHLVGASDELLHDTPYQNGDLRLSKGFFRRTGKAHPDIAPGYPMTYSYTIANHGIVFYINDHASVDQSDDHAFFVAQRHVNSSELSTGPIASRPAGKADTISDQQPVHCVYMSSESPVLFSDFDPFFSKREVNRQYSTSATGIFDNEGNYVNRFMVDDLPAFEMKMLDMDIQGRFRRFIVREKDVLKPWERHVFAGINETDSFAVLNPLEQLSLNDEGQLVIQFPNRLGSQRFFYTGKELDLIAFCSAGAVGMDTLITSDRYGDASTGDKRRVYKGMMSSYEYGKGMRILMLCAGVDVGILGNDTDAEIEDLMLAPYGTATS